jgi:hypothetical protein
MAIACVSWLFERLSDPLKADGPLWPCDPATKESIDARLAWTSAMT